ncbi:MAG: Ldh family oxidoreductase [Armatimonadota bacterium]
MIAATDIAARLLSKRICPDALEAFCVEVMLKCGMRVDDARTTAKVLVATDAWGVHTHGTKQLRPLMRLLPDRMDPTAVPEVVGEGPGWAMVNAHYAIAMVASCMATEIAIEKAASTGIAFVGVRNSNHFGAAGYYTNMAAERGMIGLSMTNTDPRVVVPGGKIPMLGTNPFSYAVPAGDEPTVFLDIATSVVAASKIIAAKARNECVPENWLVDQDGVTTTDPHKWPGSANLLPMAGHKGYGLSLMIEILSSVITGADFMVDVKAWIDEHPGPLNQGHAFIVIDIEKFMPLDQFKARMDSLIRTIRNSPKAEGSKRIYLPGEMEWENREIAVREGMSLPEDVVNNLIGVAHDAGVDIESFIR